MATTKKYNPYDDVKNVVHYKSLYDQAKAEGKDPSQYQQSAIQYYNNLRNNDYGDMADELTKSGYERANAILGGLQPDKEYDEWYDNITGDIVKQQANNEVQSETVKNLMNTYNSNNNLLNGAITTDANGNVVSGLNLDHYNTGKNQLDYINNYDITAQPWYSSLMQGYQLQGQDAANGALASGASSNSGNIDSYAAANANRQQLAFTNAGNEAARAMALQNMEAWQNLYDSMGGRLDTMGSQNNDALNIGASYYATDSSERQNALNQAATLEQQKLQNQINELMANISADTEKHTSDNTLKGTLDYNAKNLEGTKYTSNADLQAAYANAEANKYGSLMDYKGVLDTNEKNLEGTKITSANDLAAAIRQAEADEYGANMDYNGTVYKTNNSTSGDDLDKEQTLDEASAAMASQILDGDSNITSWEEFRDELVKGGYNIDKVNNLIKSWKKTYPNLFSGTTQTTTQTAQLPELEYDEEGEPILPDGFELPSSYSTKGFNAHLKHYMNGGD